MKTNLAKSSLLFILLLSFVAKLSGSVPDIINYSTKEYKSHSINYCIAQDSTGTIYIGNAYCVLEFDGRSWRKIPLVDGKSALSMVSDPKGNIMVTSSSEFGYLTKDSLQNTVYISLKHLLSPEDAEAGEFLDLTFYNGIFFFRSQFHIYKYENGAVQRIKGTHDKKVITNLQVLNGKVCYHEQGVGHGVIERGIAKITATDTKEEAIMHIADLKGNLFQFAANKIIGNKNLGKEVDPIINASNVTCVLKLNDKKAVLGTISGGIVIINEKGVIERILTTRDGLQDNYVRDIYKDDVGNVWIAYNNGIGLVKLNSPIEYITKSQKIDGLGYCGLEFNNTLYLGTSQGLFYLEDWRSGLKLLKPFTRINGINGTVNDLKVHNGKLIACQHAEVYQVDNNIATRLSNGWWYGAWIWAKDPFNENKAFVGTYIGVTPYEFVNGEWKAKEHVKGFKESTRVLQVDDRGVIWAVQGNKGLYRVEINEAGDSAISVTNYSDLYGFAPSHFNDIFRFNDKIYVTSYNGVYTLNKDSLNLEPSFNSIKKQVERTRKYNGTGLYAIYDNLPHLLELKGKDWKVKNSPVSNVRSNMVGSAEFFEEIAPDIFLIGIEEGFAIYKPFEATETKKKDALIRKFEVLSEHNDSVLYNGTPNRPITLDYSHNDIRVTFSIPAYAEIKQIEFETQLVLKGKSSESWQRVKEVNFKEYTNIREGTYEFKVRAVTGMEEVGNTSFSFEVLPPWYRTNVANGFYVILMIIFVIVIKKKFDAQKIIMEREKEKELAIADKLHKAEKLEIELQNKENELAYMALTYTQKKEMLNSLKGKLDALSKEVNSDDRSKLNSLKRSITSGDDDESNWENFQLHFDQKNDNFFSKLKEKDGKLNESYLLFCSYVRMGKSNKEIAELLNISVAAVEKRKYRLKKKWELPDDESFTDYLKEL